MEAEQSILSLEAALILPSYCTWAVPCVASFLYRKTALQRSERLQTLKPVQCGIAQPVPDGVHTPEPYAQNEPSDAGAGYANA